MKVLVLRLLIKNIEQQKKCDQKKFIIHISKSTLSVENVGFDFGEMLVFKQKKATLK